MPVCTFYLTSFFFCRFWKPIFQTHLSSCLSIHSNYDISNSGKANLISFFYFFMPAQTSNQSSLAKLFLTMTSISHFKENRLKLWIGDSELKKKFYQYSLLRILFISWSTLFPFLTFICCSRPYWWHQIVKEVIVYSIAPWKHKPHFQIMIIIRS